ncbi:uncharacterized protein DMENIID0001_071490 [Sergentomyia squamirostris]
MYRILKRCLNVQAKQISVVFGNSIRGVCTKCRKHEVQVCSGKIFRSWNSNFRAFSSSFSDTEEESDSEIGVSDLEIKRTRDILYENAEEWDDVMRRLKKAGNFEEIFSELKSLQEDQGILRKEHLVQSILTLWDVHKDLAGDGENLSTESEMKFLLEKIHENVTELSLDEISCCLLYLTKLELENPALVEDLKNHFLTMVTESEAELSMAALSRFSTYMNQQRNFSIFSICSTIMPVLVHRLETCAKSDDMHHLTVCMGNLVHIITPHQMELYRKKVDELYQQGIISSSTPRCILRVVNFLNFIYWSQDNNLLIRSLILLLRDAIPDMDTRDLVGLCQVFQSRLEPANLLPAIKVQSEKLLDSQPSAELLECFIMDAMPETRTRVAEEAEKIIQKGGITSLTNYSGLFKVLRSLKMSNARLFNAYWSHVLEKISSDELEKENYRLARHCHRYMHFNNNIGGTYRFYKFERHLVNLIMQELETGMSRYIPSKFAKIAPFVIAYGHTEKSREKLPEFIVERIEAMRDQFSAKDCLNLSRGIQIALEMRFKNQIIDNLGNQLARIETVINACTEKFLAQNDISLIDLSSLIRGYNARKASRTTYLFERLIRRYEKITTELNSRLIRDITFNINASQFHLPKMCDKMIEYLKRNEKYVIGDTTEKILYSCYNIGYQIEDEEVFETASNIIDRDFNYMSGLSIVQSCLALCFYKALPVDLVNRVFCTDFIQRLEHEIRLCYSKATYPQRVFHQVMQLNRAVCLDYPERNVPWFQNNFIESRVTAFSVTQSKFHEDVHEILHSLSTSRDVVRVNHVTPYGYRVDFVMHFDHLQRLIPPPKTSEAPVENVSKVGLLLHNQEAFCANSKHLRGFEQLRQRHLEILGYRVLHLAQNDWNSMYLSVPGAKSRFLRKLLNVT